METLTDWWSSLSTDDRARILVPYIQLQSFAKKPWKCDWEHTTTLELDRLHQLVKEQKQLTHLKRKQK